MCTYTNKNRIDAVLRVEKFTTQKSNLSIRAEITQKIYYNSNYKSLSSVLKPTSKSENQHRSDLDVRISNVGIPFVQKEVRDKAPKRQRDTNLIAKQVKRLIYIHMIYTVT